MPQRKEVAAQALGQVEQLSADAEAGRGRREEEAQEGQAQEGGFKRAKGQEEEEGGFKVGLVKPAPTSHTAATSHFAATSNHAQVRRSISKW